MNEVKSYFRGLWLALTGKNPYRMELELLHSNYTKLETLVAKLNKDYYLCQEKMNKDAARIASLQNLVESLRQRIKDKDLVIELAQNDFKRRVEETKQDYMRKIEAYSKELAE